MSRRVPACILSMVRRGLSTFSTPPLPFTTPADTRLWCCARPILCTSMERTAKHTARLAGVDCLTKILYPSWVVSGSWTLRPTSCNHKTPKLMPIAMASYMLGTSTSCLWRQLIVQRFTSCGLTQRWRPPPFSLCCSSFTSSLPASAANDCESHQHVCPVPAPLCSPMSRCASCPRPWSYDASRRQFDSWAFTSRRGRRSRISVAAPTS